MDLGLNPASGCHQVISPLQHSHLEFSKKIFHEGCDEHEAVEAKLQGAHRHRYRGQALERSFSC